MPLAIYKEHRLTQYKLNGTAKHSRHKQRQQEACKQLRIPQ